MLSSVVFAIFFHVLIKFILLCFDNSQLYGKVPDFAFDFLLDKMANHDEQGESEYHVESSQGDIHLNMENGNI